VGEEKPVQSEKSCVLSFLWDKWKYQDDLMYKRLNAFLALQTVLIGSITILYTAATYPTVRWTIAALLILASLFSFPSYWLVRTDRRVRNTFNREIVRRLRELKILRGKEALWDEEHWSPEKDGHPVNLWHTPAPESRGKGVRGSGIIEKLILVVATMEFLLGVALFGYLIAG